MIFTAAGSALKALAWSTPIVFGVTVLVGAGPLAARLTTPELQPHCQAGKWPEFNYGFAALRLDLGDAMGDPVECEHAIDAIGDTQQQTTTGTASYDHVANIPSYNFGTDNWALSTRGLVFWSGRDGSPMPADAVAIPSPGAARLAQAAEQNSRPPGVRPLIGTGPGPIVTSVPSLRVPETEIGPVGRFLGVSDQRVQSMTLADVVALTVGSGRSMGEAARAVASTG
jgi:hypothetical protein